MKANQHSKTAEAVAMSRAIAYETGDHHVLPDKYAINFLSPIYRLIIKTPILRWLVFKKLYGNLSYGVACTVLGRSQYSEDRAEEMLKKSLKQFIMLGAGLDSFVYRRPDLVEKLTVFEVDHPATQKVKLERAKEQGLIPPENLLYVPCDFEKDSVQDVLLDAGFKKRQKTIIAWLGIIHYLTPEAIDTVLAELSALVPVGSEIVFDYYHDNVFQENAPAAAKQIMRSAARRGEPMQSAFTAASLKPLLKKQGWELQEVLSPDDIEQRYFNRPAVFARDPFSFVWFARAKNVRKK